jgi:hypothetical protein
MGLGDSPSEVHHLKFGSGASDRASDFTVVALCVCHHRVEYPESVHALKEHGLRLRYNLSEIDLLADTIAGVNDLLYATGNRLVHSFGVEVV